MALAKVYDTADTIMVALDLEFTDGLSEALMGSAAVVETTTPMLAQYVEALRTLAGAVDDARISAGLSA